VEVTHHLFIATENTWHIIINASQPRITPPT